MKVCLVVLALMLGACNSVEQMAASGISRAVSLGSNIQFDTNGYYGHRSGPQQKICEVRVNKNLTKWVPCK